MQPLEVTKGDDLPDIYMQLIDGESQLPIDLSGKTVSAKFRLKGDDTVLNTISCTLLFGGTTGWISMAWSSTQLDVTSGRYEIEVYMTTGSNVQTVAWFRWKDGLKFDWSKTVPVKVRSDF